MPYATLPMVGGQISNPPETSLRNRNALVTNLMCDESGAHHSRPGLSLFATALSSTLTNVGALIPYKNRLISVLSDRTFRSYDSNANVTNITGENLPGTDPPTWLIDQDGTLLITGGGPPIKYTGFNVTQVNASADAGWAPKPTHLAVVQRYLVANDTGNDDMYYTSTTDHSAWDPGQRVFQAESRRDPVISMLTSNNFLFLFGSETVDVYYPTNSASPAFSRAFTVSRGAVGPRACINVDETVYFMDTRRRICRFDDRHPTVISNDIERQLLALSKVSDCVANRVDYQGRKLIVWNFPTAATAFVMDYHLADGPHWYEWKSWSESRGQFIAFPIVAYAYQPEWGRHFCSNGQQIYELSTAYGDDNGTEIRRVIRSGFINHGSTVRKRSKLFRLRASRGETTTQTLSPELLVRWRDEDLQWGPYRQLDLGSSGERDLLGAELRACGMYRERQWEIACSENVPRLVLWPPEEDFEPMMR